MRILAIDPSITSLGYAYEAPQGVVTGKVVPKKLKGLERLEYVLESVEGLLATTRPDLVVYEGYAMGKFAGRSFDLGELGGLLKMAIWTRRIRILLVPPSSLKLFATGKGNADKEAVMKAMSKHRGALFTSDDEADAYALLQLGIAFCDARQMPRDRRHFKHAAIRGCEIIKACGC